MPAIATDIEALTAFAERCYGVPRTSMRVGVAPLHGGLSSTVAHVRFRFLNPALRPRTAFFIAKTIDGQDAREAGLYRSLLSSSGVPFAPRLLGVDRIEPSGSQLYLETVPSSPGWPWSDDETIGLVMDRLAEVHGTLRARRVPGGLKDWDYDREVAGAAAATLEELHIVVRDPAHSRLRRFLSPVRRMVGCLERLRRALLGGGPVCVLHGDTHPGNVLLRHTGRIAQPVFLDWARARLGSPLEDVSSWLQSLGFWEDTARRHHDMLLRRYLRARGLSDSLAPGLRQLYWLSRTSNALAGTMRFHMLRMRDMTKPEWMRIQSADSALDWGRSIARARLLARGRRQDARLSG